MALHALGPSNNTSYVQAQRERKKRHPHTPQAQRNYNYRKELSSRSNYLHFELDNIRWVNSTIILNDGRLIPKVVVIVHRIVHNASMMTRNARNPSTLHVVVSDLLPTHIQFLQSFEDFRHYFTRMSSGLPKWRPFIRQNNKREQKEMCRRNHSPHYRCWLAMQLIGLKNLLNFYGQ